jgi:hypothetical protein
VILTKKSILSVPDSKVCLNELRSTVATFR